MAYVVPEYLIVGPGWSGTSAYPSQGVEGVGTDLHLSFACLSLPALTASKSSEQTASHPPIMSARQQAMMV